MILGSAKVPLDTCQWRDKSRRMSLEQILARPWSEPGTSKALNKDPGLLQQCKSPSRKQLCSISLRALYRVCRAETPSKILGRGSRHTSSSSRKATEQANCPAWLDPAANQSCSPTCSYYSCPSSNSEQPGWSQTNSCTTHRSDREC